MAMTDEERRERKREAAQRYKTRHPEKDREKRRRAVARWRARNPELARERGRKASRRWKAGNLAKNLLFRCRQNAKDRGRECTLTVEDIETMLVPMVCAATGLPLSLDHPGGGSKRNPWAPSVDRIDCSRGYLPGNVRVVCWAFNTMRSDFPDEVVLTLARALVARAP